MYTEWNAFGKCLQYVKYSLLTLSQLHTLQQSILIQIVGMDSICFRYIWNSANLKHALLDLHIYCHYDSWRLWIMQSYLIWAVCNLYVNIIFHTVWWSLKQWQNIRNIPEYSSYRIFGRVKVSICTEVGIRLFIVEKKNKRKLFCILNKIIELYSIILIFFLKVILYIFDVLKL